MKSVLVTGGAGFVGSHLCEYLLKQKYDVVCVDNLLTGSEANIEHLKSSPNFQFYIHDIIDPLNFGRVDEIYNLACPASPPRYQNNPVHTYKTSVIGSLNLLEYARKYNIKILQASTSEIYGDPVEHPQKENYWGNVNPNGVRSCYSEDTEVLTSEGWKVFPELSLRDKLLTVNSRQEYEYHSPVEIIKECYDGSMIHFEGVNCDLLVTPNHKMYVRNYGSQSLHFVDADDISWQKFVVNQGSFLKLGHNKDEILDVKDFKFTQEFLDSVRDRRKGQGQIRLISSINMDLWLEFLGYYISEGNCYRSKTRGGYTIYIAQDKEVNLEKWKKIDFCLSQLGVSYSYSNHQFVLTNKQLFRYLAPLGKSHEKYIPQEFLQLSKRQLRILWNALMLGDGCRWAPNSTYKAETYYTSSWKLASNIQELLLKLELASDIKINKLAHSNTRTVYYLRVKGLNTKSARYSKVPARTTIQYRGNVWCVNIPNHTIYVRRNGKAMFCGNCYDEGKRAAETAFSDFRRQYNLDTKIVRIFNTYGPRMAELDGRVVSNFIVQALKNKPITIYGDGSQTRSFQYIDDLIRGLYAVMQLPPSCGQPINLGNPNEFTIKQLAETVIGLTNSSSEIIYCPLPQDDPKQRKPDIALAKELLDWEPKIELEKGLRKTINYFEGR